MPVSMGSRLACPVKCSPRVGVGRSPLEYWHSRRPTRCPLSTTAPSQPIICQYQHHIGTPHSVLCPLKALLTSPSQAVPSIRAFLDGSTSLQHILKAFSAHPDTMTAQQPPSSHPVGPVTLMVCYGSSSFLQTLKPWWLHSPCPGSSHLGDTVHIIELFHIHIRGKRSKLLLHLNSSS
jgi:hypothetical protein